MSRKTILYVSPNGYLGGAERVVLNLAIQHLKESQFKPIILFFHPGEAIDAASEAGVEIKLLQQPFRLSRPFSLLKALLEIRKIIKNINPDIIHSTMAYSHLTISLATMGMKVKEVWFQHGPVGKFLDRLASFFPTQCLFFNSNFLKDLHYQSRPYVKTVHQSLIIPPGVMPAPQRQIFQTKRITIGTAGRICHGKAFEYIIQALEKVSVENSTIDFELKIAGSVKNERDQPYFDHLKKLASDSKIKHRIEFLGHVSDMNSFYQTMDLFIHSSAEPEPFGLVVAEAMANNCLVLASDKGGVLDLVTNAVTGFSYQSTAPPPLAINDLAMKLISIFAADNTTLNEIADNGRRFVESNFSTNHMIKKTEKSYLNILNL